MIVYGIRASGPMVCFDHRGVIYSRKLYRQPPTTELEEFRSKLENKEKAGLTDLIPEEADLTIVEFELED